MLYNWLKIIHVISAMILFGVGIGTALYMMLVNQQSDLKLIAKVTRQVVFADWCFTATSGLIQAVTGLWMVYLEGYSFTELWILGSIIGYVIAGLCWFPVVYLQIKCRDLACSAVKSNQPLPKVYYRYFNTWRILGIPAFLSLIVVFYFMANRPV